MSCELLSEALLNHSSYSFSSVDKFGNNRGQNNNADADHSRSGSDQSCENNSCANNPYTVISVASLPSSVWWDQNGNEVTRRCHDLDFLNARRTKSSRWFSGPTGDSWNSAITASKGITSTIQYYSGCVTAKLGLVGSRTEAKSPVRVDLGIKDFALVLKSQSQ